MCQEENEGSTNNSLNLSLLLQYDCSYPNLSFLCPLATLEDLANLSLLSFLLEGVLQFIISCLGILGNTVSLYILTRKELHSFFNQLLTGLVIYDLVYLLTMMLGSLRKFGVQSDLHIVLFPYVLYPMNAISMMGSIYMTMAVGMERYIAVYQPMEYSRVANDASAHTKRLLTYVLPITLFSVFFNIPKFLDSQVVYKDNEVYMEVTDLRMSTPYVTWDHNWARLMVLGVFPLIVICYLNYKIYVVISKRRKIHRRKQDDNLSVVLMIIIISFTICNILRVVLNMHEITVIEEIHICRNSNLGGFPLWIIILGFISPILLVIHSSANLLIYCVFGTKFRQIFYSYLACWGQESNQDQGNTQNKNIKKKGLLTFN